MRDPVRITDVAVTVAPDDDRRSGLLAYLAVTVNRALRVTGLALRRSSAGELYVSFPARTDDAGRHAILHPIDEKARLEIERQIFAELRRRRAS